MTNPFPKDHIFADFRRTDVPENIYYADLFEINGRNWMIQGYGKTDAARIASNKNRESMIATDSVAIIRDGNALFGRYDPGALNSKKSELFAPHKLDAIAYCLNEENTVKAFEPRGGKREIVEVDNVLLSALCATYQYPAYMAPHFFSESEMEYLTNPWRMTQNFAALTQDVEGTKFLLVPFMPTIEEKAALYSSFIF